MIFCNRYDCLFNEPTDEDHWFGEDKRMVTPFEDDVIRGMCSCENLYIRLRKITQGCIEHEIPECMNYSARKRKGHMDWAKYPQGGNIG